MKKQFLTIIMLLLPALCTDTAGTLHLTCTAAGLSTSTLQLNTNK